MSVEEMVDSNLGMLNLEYEWKRAYMNRLKEGKSYLDRSYWRNKPTSELWPIRTYSLFPYVPWLRLSTNDQPDKINHEFNLTVL